MAHERMVAAPEKPQSLDGYLELLTKAHFKSGLSLRTVEAKWHGFREAFEGFDAERVANFGEEDVERLASDERIVRSRPKIEGTVENTRRMLEIESGHGSFEGYLSSLGEFPEMVADLKRRSAYVGDASAHWFLYHAGADVPPYEKKR